MPQFENGSSISLAQPTGLSLNRLPHIMQPSNTSLYGPIREFRTKLASGVMCFGPAISLSDPAVTESLGPLADFFWIDLEHSPLSLESVVGHLIAARAVGVATIVRVPASEPWFIKRVIDSGALGIIVPQIRSADEAKRVVEACRYRPEGDRGYGPRRASNYGYDTDYLANANRDLFVSVQIERADALRELEAIASVEGLDSLVLGPFDLSISMGFPGQVTHPEVTAAMRRVVDCAKAHRLFVGMGGPAMEAYGRNARALGVQWLQLGSDFEYMGQSFRALTSKLRADAPPVV